MKVHWLGHDSVVLRGSRRVIIDPFRAKGDYKADLLLISREHQDHLSEDDIRRFTNASTTIVAPSICEKPLRAFTQEKKFVVPSSKIEAKGVSLETVPAYNLNKFREPGRVFHPKADGRVGYIVTLDGVRFYHSGDGDATPEMKSLKIDVAFLPVSGTYVMTAEEASEAANAMKVDVVVPMHIGAIIGSRTEAERFKRLEGSKSVVQILEKE